MSKHSVAVRVPAGTSATGAGGPDLVVNIVESVVRIIAPRYALAVEVHIFVEVTVGDASGQVCFVKHRTVHAAPINLAIRFLDALVIAVIGVRDTCSGCNQVLSVEGIAPATCAGNRCDIPRRVIGERGDAVVGTDRQAEAVWGAAVVRRRIGEMESTLSQFPVVSYPNCSPQQLAGLVA